MKSIQLITVATAAILLTLCQANSVLPTDGDLNAAGNIAAKIFTEEMAQSVLGAPVQPASRNSDADIKNGATTVSQCSYSIKGDAAVMPTSVSLLLRRAGSADEAKTIFLSSKTTYNGEAVAGLGDDAYRTAAPPQLNVLKGRNWLIISAGAFPKADPALQEKATREILKSIQE